MTGEHYYLGIAAALAAGSLWSLGPGVIRRYAGGERSYVVNMVRSLYAVAFLAALIPLVGESYAVDIRGVAIIYVSAFFGPLLGDTLYIASIKRIGGGNAVTLAYTYIFFAQLYSHILYGEPLHPRLLAGTLIALLGIHTVYRGEKHMYDRKGFAAAMAAALSWGMGAALSKATLMYGDPLPIALYRNAAVAATLLLLGYRRLRAVAERNMAVIGIVTGGLGFGVGMTLFLYAITGVGVAVTALATSITPVLGRIVARKIAHEKPSRKAYLGTLLTAAGILVGLLKL